LWFPLALAQPTADDTFKAATEYNLRGVAGKIKAPC
jgi:hypothetical protein